MNINRIKKIVIVGGGTSAWCAAAFLSHNLTNIEITVIDKEIGTPVGVGEGTVLTFKWFLDNCGIDIDRWFPSLDASYKAGVLFPNWRNKGHTIWHPFMCNPTLDYTNDVTLIDALSCSTEQDYIRAPGPLYDISTEKNLFDRNELANYAFHVDCSKLVAFLQEELKDKINFVKSEVIEIDRDNSNNIISLKLKNGDVIYSDLFVDCTGFKSILQNKAEKINLEDRLFVNTAVAGQVQYHDKNSEARPYVICDAVDHGWIWTIPVMSRMGSGLVFNRNVTDVEEAKDYLCDYWEGRLDRERLKVIDWTPFYCRNQWEGNVVSIGLSAGFIEPLESTGIALICEGVKHFANLIKDCTWSDSDKIIFNTKMNIVYEECIDFVNMHYSDCQRTEKFWRYVKEKFYVSERQKFYIELLSDPDVRCNIPFKIDHLFSANNWFCWLLQLGYTAAPRNFNRDYAQMILQHHAKMEKTRFIKSRHHNSELERLKDYYRTSNGR